MPVWQWVVDVAGILLLLALGYGIALVVRRRLLARNGGTFELSYHLRTDRPGRGWMLGLGRYSGERLEWYRLFSLSAAPQAVLATRVAGLRRPARAAGRRADFALPRPPGHPLPDQRTARSSWR